ncbi:hypothetical protein [Caulobacter sp. S45]|uniref:hypothetical protein n=1 Tax=Caulobacter sp. S45 TaxID=1641861 RepID=UPI001576791D|nr:hypothetical protein [Caulobacter sp. S45]
MAKRATLRLFLDGSSQMTKRNIQTHQPDLHIRMRPVAALIANPANARKHPPRQIDLLKSSIKQFGFVAPILIGGTIRLTYHATAYRLALLKGRSDDRSQNQPRRSDLPR